MLAIATFNASNRGHQIRPLFFFAISSVLIAYFDCKINTFLSIKYAKTEKVTLQRHGKLYTTIYYSGSINHSGTVKKLDSQAQITCHSPLTFASDYRDCSIFMKYFLQMDAIRFKFCSFARDLCR